MTAVATRVFAVGPGEGRRVSLGGLGTFIKVPSEVTGGRVALVEHALSPGALGAPLHRHMHEDELSLVLEGAMGAMIGADIVVAPAGSYVMQPRHHWHTFWNGGPGRLRFVSLLLPGGLERSVERLASLMAAARGNDASALDSLAAEYGIDCDMDSVPELCARFGLSFAAGA